MTFCSLSYFIMQIFLLRTTLAQLALLLIGVFLFVDSTYLMAQNNFSFGVTLPFGISIFLICAGLNGIHFTRGCDKKRQENASGLLAGLLLHYGSLAWRRFFILFRRGMILTSSVFKDQSNRLSY